MCSHACTLTHIHTVTYSHPHSLFLSLSQSHTHTHTLSLSHTHTHTSHTQVCTRACTQSNTVTSKLCLVTKFLTSTAVIQIIVIVIKLVLVAVLALFNHWLSGDQSEPLSSTVDCSFVQGSLLVIFITNKFLYYRLQLIQVVKLVISHSAIGPPLPVTLMNHKIYKLLLSLHQLYHSLCQWEQQEEDSNWLNQWMRCLRTPWPTESEYYCVRAVPCTFVVTVEPCTLRGWGHPLVADKLVLLVGVTLTVMECILDFGRYFGWYLKHDLSLVTLKTDW